MNLALKERIPGAHAPNLRSLGVEAAPLQGWAELLDLRYEEYAKDRHEVRRRHNPLMRAKHA